MAETSTLYKIPNALALLDVPSPLLQFKRFRGKINIQRPRAPHYERALFNAVTKPVYEQPSLTEQCAARHAAPTVAARTVVDNPYERIIAKEVSNWFAHSQLVAVYHINSISSEDLFKARVQFFKQNMHLKAYSKHIMKRALADSQYANLLPLFDAKNCVVFAPEQKLAQLLRISKRIPQMVLLAGVVEQRLMSRNQLQEFAALPSLDVARAQLVGVMQQAAGNQIVQHLQAHQTQLCAALDAYASSGETTTATDSEPTEETVNEAETK